MPLSFHSSHYEAAPDDEDVYGMMTLTDGFDNVANVKILLSDHLADGVIDHVRSTDTEADLYLIVSRVMASKIHGMGYGPMFQRALTLTAMELISSDE